MGLVCILWLDGDDICRLKYGDGKVRTYPAAPTEPVDGRVGEMMVVENEKDLWLYLRTGLPRCVPVALAREVFGWEEQEFDIPSAA